MKIAKLDDRSLIQISGEDAEKFLENIVTCKIEGLAVGDCNFGALLTPQGKIMFDFFVARNGEGFLFDIDSELALEFIKRMTFYKLRAKVTISRVEAIDVYAVWDGTPNGGYEDKRMSEMGQRLYSSTTPEGETSNYTTHRIGCGIPQGGIDFQYGDAYPHEVLMDQSSGVDFKKGCYVGQEVVSRMQHRGTTKKRVVKVSSDTALPESGTSITADGKPAGVLGSVFKNLGLALLRLDRVAKAQEVLAGDAELTITVQDWVNFKLPVTSDATSNE